MHPLDAMLFLVYTVNSMPDDSKIQYKNYNIGNVQNQANVKWEYWLARSKNKCNLAY